MLGLGWTEMLVIGVVALIVIGPKDLPVVMGRVGKVIGQIQRMGREFQREINKATGLDEVRNLRNTIASPLKKTAEEIRRDFNAIGKDGQETPTGALKPTDPKTESVVEAIQQQAGMSPAPVSPAKSSTELASEYGFKSSAARSDAKPAPVKATRAKPAAKSAASTEPGKSDEAKAVAAGAAKPKAARKPKAAASAGAVLTEPAPSAAAAPKPKTVRKPAATKAPAAGDIAEVKPIAKPRAPRKKPADTAEKS